MYDSPAMRCHGNQWDGAWSIQLRKHSSNHPTRDVPECIGKAFEGPLWEKWGLWRLSRFEWSGVMMLAFEVRPETRYLVARYDTDEGVNLAWMKMIILPHCCEILLVHWHIWVSERRWLPLYILVQVLNQERETYWAAPSHYTHSIRRQRDHFVESYWSRDSCLCLSRDSPVFRVWLLNIVASIIHQ